jgi:hypothetical protein
MASRRAVDVPDPYQGVDEVIVRALDVSANGSGPSSVSVVVKNAATLADITDIVMPTGSPTVNGDVITLPALRALTAGVAHRHEVKYTLEGNVLEDYFDIIGEL